MEYKTLDDIKNKLKRDLYLQDATFVEDSASAPELTDLINEAIDDVEAEVHTIYEDYFLAQGTISLVSGTKDYSLPANIYASKIRALVYTNGSIIYSIERVKNQREFEEFELTDQYAPNGPSTQGYLYKLINQSATLGVQVRFFPTPQETAPNVIKIWYLRNANKLSTGTDKCDVPEFFNYIVQFVKVRIYEKEMHPNLGQALLERDRLKNLMQETLAEMIPDADSEIAKDFSFYEDMS